MKTKPTPSNKKTLRKRIAKPASIKIIPEHLHGYINLDHSSLFIPLD